MITPSSPAGRTCQSYTTQKHSDTSLISRYVTAEALFAYTNQNYVADVNTLSVQSGMLIP